jgi:carbamate kinase
VRTLIALGGNAMTGPGGSATPLDQDTAVAAAMEHVADLVKAGVEVVLTHGNGPQVGNLLVKNELAAAVVPPVPLDWCGAQTQGTIGFLIMDALDRALAQRGVDRSVATLVTRTRVDGADPGFARPTKPIGRYLPAEEAAPLIEHGQTWEDRGARGWRRVVASPDPLEILDVPAIRVLSNAGYVVVAAGGGGIPVVRDDDGGLRGVEAVIDKDLASSLLARQLNADLFVMATDVDGVYLDWGTPDQRKLDQVTVAELGKHSFAGGSMGPKVAAAMQFAERSGKRAAIGALQDIEGIVNGTKGTNVVPD